jgi:hypothetical protein
MFDYWRHGDKKWNTAERTAVARLFRAHVDTPSNRLRGRSCRIHREACAFHPGVTGEAHHVDYARPFLVAWLCARCHRRVDHGGVKLLKKHVWDYTSLIDGVAKHKLRRPRVAVAVDAVAAPF